MTDEQIIIDEVKCPWFNDGSCDLFYSDKEECWYRKCKDTPNCYYRETQTQLKRKEQECEELKKYLNQIRDEELSHLDIEWDEYETSARQEDYSNIITLVERALGEVND